MAFKIEERFEVQAPVERVWKYLIDPQRVVECLPGAELLEQQDERTFLGAIKVKVGPLAMSYKGQAKFTEINEETHQVRICLLYTSDAADERSSVDLGGCR